MITITYKCDKCGYEQNNDDQGFVLIVDGNRQM